ncbi:inactive N-acetylated-alpha-linked acidic dipeptidase-like protein 2 isoform X1 [Anas platyrhynchos]|uniref:N-acetylated alpha-linked acidic dipeptidase like 2 n=1 Tax=Anas platyrhynchos platyrhynchos TaxID=8840 RepID=A0A493SUM3_ANAPP|nr:inactive N-acetylated-alpha-linked acidic dipeptidase-like protein 2 isoform X2 [Anas platyrhynchos]|eukprot:XP_027319680.1 inactive N-acetylated-alpha-linked acidic dipeptidase-like protein 2 isoform X1 [Anas platyrhynchos]
MGENESSLPNTSPQDKKMAYHKVNADQRAQGHSPYLDNDDLQATALELEWDMEKELEEPGFDHFRLDGAVQHHLGNSQSPDLDLEPIQPSTSPKGRFQRLQEDPDYISHYTRQAPKNNRCNFFQILKVFCTALIVFIFGIVIGYYSGKKCPSPPASPEPNNPHTYHEILKEIKAENIQQIYRDLLQFSREDDVDTAMKILVQWTSYGLEDVQLVNYSVLLDLPGSSSNTITLKNSGECFYPDGQQCNRGTKTLHSQDLLYSYAAYSAKGTLEAELVDVQYGTIEDLIRIQAITNVTKKIALLKLGQSPLLYKLSLLEDAGFGGVLLYVDPCDLPKTTDLADKAFMVSLNSGGDPSTPGYASIDGSYRQHRLNLTTLLVQPISAVLAKKIISVPENSIQKDRCVPLQLPSTEKKIISLNIQSVTTYRTISNVIGYLKGTVFPDRYVLIGSHHSSLNTSSGQEWASSTAIITAFIQALMLKVKRGWRPDRTIVFCSWGGTSFGNIGSYEWAEDLKRVLQRNVVAYVSLHNPVRGNSTLHPIASPSLQQLTAESQSFNCVEKTKCPGSNVSSVQIQGDSDYFINHLGVPATQFSYEDINKSENSSFLSEALFPVHATKTEELDPSFKLHETIAKLTGQVTLQIANEPVLPFNALDIALEVQNSLKVLIGDKVDASQLLAVASQLRDTAELFQSDEMRPANDPKERAPIRVRMLNDVLQSLEKSFLVQQAPPGLYRNILYRLDERTNQFSVLLEALEHYKLHQSNETIQAALSEVLNSISSAQVYFKAGLDVFETTLAGKK